MSSKSSPLYVQHWKNSLSLNTNEDRQKLMDVALHDLQDGSPDLIFPSIILMRNYPSELFIIDLREVLLPLIEANQKFF